MCGIIAGFHTGKDAQAANEWAINQYEDQHRRGSQGFGIIGWKPGGKVDILRATEPIKFMFDMHAKEYPMMIVHHRFPTSTENKIKQTHPIVVDSGSLRYRYLVIHNGVIRNTDALYKKHTEELGFVYTTADQDDFAKKLKFNDSECLAIEVARFIEKQSHRIEAIGNAAFIALQIDRESDKPSAIFFGRNEGNPLKMGKSRHKMHLSSEGEGELITPFTLYSCLPTGEMKLAKRPMLFAEEPKPVYSWDKNKPSYGYAGKTTNAPAVIPTAVQTGGTPLPGPNQQKLINVHDAVLDDDEFERWKSAELADMPGGGGFDDDIDAMDMDLNSIFTDAIDEIDAVVTEQLEELCDMDSAIMSSPDEAMKKIRMIFENSKRHALDLWNLRAKQAGNVVEPTVV